jgi:hypothetical protein
MGVPAQSRESETLSTGSVQDAEDLLRSLTGVRSVRIVTGTDGEIEEIHVLTSDRISPKQTVRNVESALLAHLNLPIDHRKISVAQTEQGAVAPGGPEGTMSLVLEKPIAPREGRILYRSHHAASDTPNKARFTVNLEWGGTDYTGSAVAPDLPKARMEAAVHATLRAVEAIAAGTSEESSEDSIPAFIVDGISVVKAFEQKFAFVAVQALAGRDVVSLSGAARLAGRVEASFVQATLQATDRWVRGRMA